MDKRTLYTLYFSIAAAMLGLGIISPLIPELARKFNASGFLLGLIFSGFAVARAITMPIVGIASDKIGRKIFILSGFILLVFVSFLYIAADSAHELIAVRFLHGIAAGMIMPIAMAIAGEGVEEGRESRTMANMTMMLYVGFATGPLIAGLISQNHNMADVFYVMAGISVVPLIASSLFLKDQKTARIKEKVPSMPLLVLMKRPSAKLILTATLTNVFRSSVIVAFVPILAYNLNIGPKGIGIIIAAGLFVSGFTLPAFGKLADRLGKQEKLKQIIIASSLGTLVFFAVPLCRNFSELLLVGIFAGITAAAAIAPASGISVIIGQKVGMGLWMGVYSMTLSLGILIAPLLTGIMMDYFGIKAAFYVIGGLSIAGVMGIIYFYMRWRAV